MIAFSANVTDSSGGLPAAVGDGVTDDTAAIQAHVTALGRGGTLLFPPGKYLISGDGLVVSGGVRLVGASRLTSILYRPSDGNVINFDAGAWGAELADVNIQACQTAPTQHAVVVAPNALVTLRSLNIWGGKAGLYDQGVDGLRDDCNIAGLTYQVIVAGANWWRRVKLDQVFPGTPYGLVAVAGSGENHWDMCDFSGAFPGGAILLDDPGGTAAFDFSGCVSAIVNLIGFRWANFRGHEFGAPVTTSIPSRTVISSSVAWDIPVSVPGAINGGGNINITF